MTVIVIVYRSPSDTFLANLSSYDIMETLADDDHGAGDWTIVDSAARYSINDAIDDVISNFDSDDDGNIAIVTIDTERRTVDIQKRVCKVEITTVETKVRNFILVDPGTDEGSEIKTSPKKKRVK